jgi:anti-sigma factor RsiW
MNGLNCNEFVELVTAYLEGALDSDTERRFVEHVAECEGCDRYLDQFRRTVQALGHLPTDSLNAEVRGRLLTAFTDWPRG